ncbi:MAG: hypothetical protein ACK4WD_03475 [Flavobacteriales bacterium]|jgi:hypothetical protein
MKQLIWKLVLPLTILSFVMITKSWYVAFIDGPHEVLKGFPLPYVCRGWHTSMSLQIYVLELVVDLLTYFTFWFLVIFSIHRFVVPIHISKILFRTLLVLSVLALIGVGFILADPNHIYKLHRKDEMVIEKTGVYLIGARGE